MYFHSHTHAQQCSLPSVFTLCMPQQVIFMYGYTFQIRTGITIEGSLKVLIQIQLAGNTEKFAVFDAALSRKCISSCDHSHAQAILVLSLSLIS